MTNETVLLSALLSGGTVRPDMLGSMFIVKINYVSINAGYIGNNEHNLDDSFTFTDTVDRFVDSIGQNRGRR